MRSREDLAWAAGIIDGEGYFQRHSRKRGGTKVGITVGQSSRSGDGPPEMLTRLQKILGVGKIYGPYVANKGRLPSYIFKIQAFEDVQAATAFVWTWLTPEKKAQATNMLKEVI